MDERADRNSNVVASCMEAPGSLGRVPNNPAYQDLSEK